MKPTFNLVSVCAIAALLLSNAALAEILHVEPPYYAGGYAGSGSPSPGYEESLVAAGSDSSHTLGFAWAEGEDEYYTTVDGTFSWDAYLYVWAAAYVTLDGGSADAYGAADAYVDMPSNWRSFERHVTAYDATGVGDEHEGSLSVGHTGTFYAGTGILCNHFVTCTTHSTSYGSSQAVAAAKATADAYMW